MTAPDEDYGRRERLLLHHPHQYPPPGPTPPPGAGERYISSPSPAQSHSASAAGERYLPAPTPPPGDRYIPPPAPSLSDRYLPSSERYHQSSSTSDRYLATSSHGDRYLPPAPAPGDRYLPTPSSVTNERYLPPPTPAPGERYLPQSAPAPGERYLPPPSSATPGGPGDPYMRRDLGYHHHYRLPHPSYHPHHPHHPSHHQYHPHYHHQRALPPAPHHRSLGYHPHTPHHVIPSPNRGHIRCCPSPSHYGPSADPPYLLSSTGSPGGSAGNGSAGNTPSASGSGSGGASGVVILAAGTGSSASAGTNSSSSSSSSASSASVPAASASGSVSVAPEGGGSNSREYMTSPSPLLPHRGRTPPCNNGGANSVVSQRLSAQSPSASGNIAPTNSASPASNVPVIEYVGASGGRHVSTPTPPLPRCDLGIENPLCGSGDGVSNSSGHHSHTHLQQPQRRGCSGVLEKLDPQGSTMSLCCGNSRRFAAMQNSAAGSSETAGELPTCATTATPSVARPESRQSLAASAATTPSHLPLQHHTTLWRAVGQGSTPAAGTSGGSGSQQQVVTGVEPSPAATPPPSAPPLGPSGPTPVSHQGAGVPLERSISAPASSQHCVGTRPLQQQPGDHQGRPTLGRSLSRTEVVKNYIKRETAVFFGVEESKEEEQQARWLDRRKRLAVRRYGSLRDEYLCPANAPRPLRVAATRQQQFTSAYATQTRDSSTAGRPDVLPGGREPLDASGGHLATTPQRWAEPPVRRKESVARMTFGGLALVVATVTRHRPRPASRTRQFSRSYPSSTVAQSATPGSPVSDDEVFFTKPLGAAAVHVVGQGPQAVPSTSTVDQVDITVQMAEETMASVFTHGRDNAHIREQYPSWRRTPLESSDSGPEVGCSRIWSRVLDRVFDNSNRRQYGMGVVGRFFGRSMKHSVTDRKAVKEQLDDIEDHRPFFTYWVTTVQVLILIISLACYGLGPIGFNLNHRSGQVLVTSLSLQQVDYQEPANFWIGPRAADLIHLGAKFTPCMRKDAKIIKEIEKGREKERETACCIRNDDSGCVQSSQADCSTNS